MKPIQHIRILKRLRRGAGTAVILGILIPQLAFANPLGPKVVSGQASFATQGKTLTVTNSDRAIINWQDFSIAGGELTRFIQPTTTSAVLNRVIGNNPSAIYGALQSNGRVYLVNQNGIFMGPTATIDVNGLVASTLNITVSDFKAGRMNFSGGPLAGRIENQGAIRTPAGGSIYLIAPDVVNSGVIHAPNGDVLLAAGKQVSLVESTTPEIAVVVSALENEALNLGQIITEAGRIGIYGGLIRHRGIVSADSAVVDKTGAIRFRATKDITFEKESMTTANGPQGGHIIIQSTEGTTLVSGAVEVKGGSDKGGMIQLLGQRVGVIDGARIDASGDRGGGTVLVGGDYQGKNLAIQNAEATYFGKDAIIKADALTRGDGGRVILWADAATRAYGALSARGGVQSGDGGFVEASGSYLDYQGFADLRAPQGKPGTLLLDPTNIYIAVDQAAATAAGMSGTDTSANTSGAPDFNASGSVADSLLTRAVLEASLGGANTVVRTANASGTGSGNIKVVSPIFWPGPYLLTLQADHDIYINNVISGSNLTLNAPGSVTQTGAIVVTTLALQGGGNYTLVKNSNSFGFVTGNVGSLNLYNSSASGLTVGTGGLTASGSVNLSSPYSLLITGPVTANVLTLNAPGYTTQSGSGTITASQLELLGGGTYGFGLTNTVGTVAGSVGGSTSLESNSPVFSIGTVNGSSGLTTSGNLNLRAREGILQVDQAINASGWVILSGKTGVAGPATVNAAGSLSISVSNGGIGASGSPLQTGVGLIDEAYAPNGGIFITNTGALKTTDEEAYFVAGGAVNVSTSGDLTIGKGGIKSGGNIALTSDGNMGITGPVVAPSQSGGDINLSSTGNISISDAYVAAGAGSTTLTAGGGITIGSNAADAYIYGNPNVNLTLNGDLVFNRVNPSFGAYVTSQSPTSTTLTFNNATSKVMFNGSQATATTSGTMGFFYGGGRSYPAVLGSSLIISGGDPYNCGGSPEPTPTPTPTPTCPTGQQLVDGVCQPITCPTGQQLVGNACEPITCPTGQQLVGNTCEPITCPTGQQLVGNLCQPIICTGGQVLVGNLCSCPAGTIDYAGVCKTPSIVPGTGNGTVIYVPVPEELTEPLQVLVQSIINAVDPSLLGTAGSPGGGTGDDPNKPKKNYCN